MKNINNYITIRWIEVCVRSFIHQSTDDGLLSVSVFPLRFFVFCLFNNDKVNANKVFSKRRVECHFLLLLILNKRTMYKHTIANHICYIVTYLINNIIKKCVNAFLYEKENIVGVSF